MHLKFLHHTKNPKQGFKIVSSWLKPEGYIVLGLYNYYGRFPTMLRKMIFRFLRKGTLARSFLSSIDPILRRKISNKKKEDLI